MASSWKSHAHFFWGHFSIFAGSDNDKKGESSLDSSGSSIFGVRLFSFCAVKVMLISDHLDIEPEVRFIASSSNTTYLYFCT